MPNDLIEISDDIFDNKQDVTGKKNIYNEKGHYMYWLFYQITCQLQSSSVIISPQSAEEVTDLLQNLMIKGDMISNATERKPSDYVECTGDIPKIDGFNFSPYVKDEDMGWARENLKKMQNMYLEIAEKVNEPELKTFYRGYASLCDMTKGNLVKALNENSFISSLFASTITGLKNSAAMPLEQAIQGLKGTHPDMANLPENQRQDIFSDYLTEQNGLFGELEAEYLRQKIEKDNWKDQDKIQQYIEKIRFEHRKIIDSFERLVKVEDVEQYDKYMDNPLNHMTERVKKGAIRGLTATTFAMKAELHALDNGWGPRDMGLLATLGGIEGGFDKYGSLYKNSNENDKLEELDKIFTEYKAIKNKWWNKKNPTSEEKLEFANEVRGFMIKYSDVDEVTASGITLSRFEETVKNVKADIALEKGKNASRQMNEADFDKMVVYYDAVNRVYDRTKNLHKTMEDGFKDNMVVRDWTVNNSPERGIYGDIISSLKFLKDAGANAKPLDIHKNLEHIKKSSKYLMELEGYEDNEDFKYLKDAFEQLIDIADDCLKDLNENYKNSVPVNETLKRTMEVMSKTEVEKASTYKAEFVKDGDDLLDQKASEFEIVGDDEIHAAKIATADYKRFISDPENAAKVEANAKKNLEERKAREKNKGKNKINVRDLEIEENPEKIDEKEIKTKAQGRNSVTNEKSKGIES